MHVGPLLSLAAVLLLVGPAVPVAATTGCCAPGPGQAEFLDRVQEYVDLHRTIAAGFDPEELCRDLQQLYRANAALASEIRAARSTAATGNVFTARAAAYLRATLASAVGAHYDVKVLLDDMDREALPVHGGPEVNGDFPWSAANAMPPGLLRVLPELPPELEYRFVGPDLVLLDVRANLIVDVLERALPSPAPVRHDRTPPDTANPQPGALRPHQPCDVHPSPTT